MRNRTLASFVTTFTVSALTLSTVAMAGPEPEPAPGGVVGGPLEHVGTLPVDAGNGLGSTVHEDLLIVTGPRSLSIYDTSTLTAGMPTLLSATPLEGIAFNEEPRTDGTRLLMGDDFGQALHLWDISAPSEPVAVTTHAFDSLQHTWACVFDDCSIVYSSNGAMLDITDMANPVELGDWNDVDGVDVEAGMHHSIDEVAPGIVMIGSEPLYLLDARHDPAAPTVIASGRMDERGMLQGGLETGVVADHLGEEFRNQPQYLAARVEWPRRTTPLADGAIDPTALLPQHDRWGIVSVETPFASDCDEGSGPLLTYDMDRVEEDGTFTLADDFRITESGEYLDGYAPAHVVGCFAYAFSQHPAYSETRLVAVAWTEHGMRLFTIDEQSGHIDEVGFFVGYGATANDAEWIAEDLIAVTDTERGIDIVRVDLDDV